MYIKQAPPKDTIDIESEGGCYVRVDMRQNALNAIGPPEKVEVVVDEGVWHGVEQQFVSKMSEKSGYLQPHRVVELSIDVEFDESPAPFSDEEAIERLTDAIHRRIGRLRSRAHGFEGRGVSPFKPDYSLRRHMATIGESITEIAYLNDLARLFIAVLAKMDDPEEE